MAASNRHLKMAFAQALARVEVKGRARQTGLVLAHFMGADGVAWVGQRRLADEWDVGRKRLAVDVAQLERVGLLDVAARTGPHGASRYRSLASFIGESADIVLACGKVLPARSSGDALEGSARAPGDALIVDEPPARSSGDALGVDGEDPSARSFGAPARSFSQSARSSGDANHQTTTPPIGGGGGGGAVPAAAVADAPSAGPAYCGESPAVQGVVRALQSLLGTKVTVPMHDRRLNGAIAAKLDRGWAGETLAALAADNPPPAKIADPGGFWAKRFAAIDGDPYVINVAKAAPTGNGASCSSGVSGGSCPHCDSLASGHQPTRCFLNPLVDETTAWLWFATVVIVAKDLGHSRDGSISWAGLDSDQLSDVALMIMIDVAGDGYVAGEGYDPNGYSRWGSSYDELFPDDVGTIAEMRNDMLLLDCHLRNSVWGRLEVSAAVDGSLVPRLRDLIKVSSWLTLVRLYRWFHAFEDCNGDLRPNSALASNNIRSLVEAPGTALMAVHDERCDRCGALTFCAHRRNGGAGTAERS